MCWVVSLSLRPSTFKGDNMKKDDRGDQDLTKQIEIKDKEIEDYLVSKELDLKATINKNEAYKYKGCNWYAP